MPVPKQDPKEIKKTVKRLFAPQKKSSSYQTKKTPPSPTAGTRRGGRKFYYRDQNGRFTSKQDFAKLLNLGLVKYRGNKKKFLEKNYSPHKKEKYHIPIKRDASTGMYFAGIISTDAPGNKKKFHIRFKTQAQFKKIMGILYAKYGFTRYEWLNKGEVSERAYVAIKHMDEHMGAPA